MASPRRKGPPWVDGVEGGLHTSAVRGLRPAVIKLDNRLRSLSFKELQYRAESRAGIERANELGVGVQSLPADGDGTRKALRTLIAEYEVPKMPEFTLAKDRLTRTPVGDWEQKWQQQPRVTLKQLLVTSGYNGAKLEGHGPQEEGYAAKYKWPSDGRFVEKILERNAFCERLLTEDPEESSDTGKTTDHGTFGKAPATKVKPKLKDTLVMLILHRELRAALEDEGALGRAARLCASTAAMGLAVQDRSHQHGPEELLALRSGSDAAMPASIPDATAMSDDEEEQVATAAGRFAVDIYGNHWRVTAQGELLLMTAAAQSDGCSGAITRAAAVMVALPEQEERAADTSVLGVLGPRVGFVADQVAADDAGVLWLCLRHRDGGNGAGTRLCYTDLAQPLAGAGGLPAWCMVPSVRSDGTSSSSAPWAFNAAETVIVPWRVLSLRLDAPAFGGALGGSSGGGGGGGGAVVALLERSEAGTVVAHTQPTSLGGDHAAALELRCSMDSHGDHHPTVVPSPHKPFSAAASPERGWEVLGLNSRLPTAGLHAMSQAVELPPLDEDESGRGRICIVGGATWCLAGAAAAVLGSSAGSGVGGPYHACSELLAYSPPHDGVGPWPAQAREPGWRGRGVADADGTPQQHGARWSVLAHLPAGSSAAAMVYAPGPSHAGGGLLWVLGGRAGPAEPSCADVWTFDTRAPTASAQLRHSSSAEPHAHASEVTSRRGGHMPWPPPLPSARFGSIAGAWGGRVWLAGGSSEGGGGGVVGLSELLSIAIDPRDPSAASGCWRREPEAPVPLPAGTLSGCMLHGTLYLLGGAHDLQGAGGGSGGGSCFVAFDTVGGKWAVLEPHPLRPRGASVASYRGEVWVVGGITHTPERQQAIKESVDRGGTQQRAAPTTSRAVFSYRPGAATSGGGWTRRPSLPAAAGAGGGGGGLAWGAACSAGRRHRLNSLAQDRLLVIGGAEQQQHRPAAGYTYTLHNRTLALRHGWEYST